MGEFLEGRNGIRILAFSDIFVSDHSVISIGFIYNKKGYFMFHYIHSTHSIKLGSIEF